jgi:hypothetical protein
MKWWAVALVSIAVVAVVAVVPRFGWGAAAQERRQARTDAEQVAAAVCGASACDVRLRGPFISFRPATIWHVQIERRGRPVLCFQLTPDTFRATSPRLRRLGVFSPDGNHSFTGVARASCASLGF